jgi:hypothetical protein
MIFALLLNHILGLAMLVIAGLFSLWLMFGAGR